MSEDRGILIIWKYIKTFTYLKTSPSKPGQKPEQKKKILNFLEN